MSQYRDSFMLVEEERGRRRVEKKHNCEDGRDVR